MKKSKLALLIGLLCTILSAGYLVSQTTSDRAEVALQAAIKTETVDGDLRAAIDQYRKIAAMPGASRATVASALLRMGGCYEKLGETDMQEARNAYERVAREYADQAPVAAQARAKLAALERGAGSAAGVTIRQVWEGPWYRSTGVPFGDGRYLSFRTESEDIAIRDLATGQIRQLTKHKGVQESAYTSIPSPDGKRVAYTWYRDGDYEVRVVGIGDAEPRVLISDPEVEWLELTDWSPDGQGVLTVLNRKDRTGVMALVSVHDASLRILREFKERVPARPRCSPDGRYIAYSLQQGPKPGESDIFVLDMESGREIPLIQHPANDVNPDWTPDGKRILFLSDRSGATGAWWIQVAEGRPQGTPALVKPDLGEDLAPIGFTRNGSYYYGMHTEMSDVYIAELDLATGKLISAPSAATQRFVGSNSKPDWSPDGRQLLFFSKRGPGAWGARAFCVRSIETGEVRELASKLDRMQGRWSSDGRSLLGMAFHPTEGIGLYRIDVQTGDFAAVPRPPGHYGYLPVSSRDGRSLIYQGEVKESKKYCVLRRDLETGHNEELFCFTDPVHFVSRLTLSPDGRQLAFVMAEDTEHRSMVLKVVPVAGGDVRDVLRGVEIPFCEASIAWTPDSSSLLFLRQAPPKAGLRSGETELWIISVQGGEPRKLELAAEGMRDIVLHPAGRLIAFTEEKDKDEVWVMENFLPPAKSVR
jgi:Tol biopolymer transport system component